MVSEPEPHVSDDAALAMTDGGLARAQNLVSTPKPWPLVCISCAAALVTDPPQRGEDRAHIAAVSEADTRNAWKITYETDDRIAQDRETSDAGRELIAEIATG